MKKTTKTTKRIGAKKSAGVKIVRLQSTANSPAGNPAGKTPLLAKQPQSKQQAAVSGGMFLHTDDHWSLAYFDENDLHCTERKLFG